MFKLCLVTCLGILLIKILSGVEIKNILAFAFGLSFVFGVYDGHCFLSFSLQKKKQKIVAGIDFIFSKYESKSATDSDEYLHTKKSKEKRI